MKEMLTKPVVGPKVLDFKSPLSVSVPVFVPTAGSTLIASKGQSGGESKTVQCPAPYDESSVWEAYSTQFDLLAGLNMWKEREKAAHLAISLLG